MKKIYKPFIVIILFCECLHIPLYSQVLNVPQVIQEQNQWCWAASSACVLDYFNYTTTQCTIAEFTRSVSTTCNPNNFGTINCCSDPSQGCNQWNYNWGCPGSIQDILIHFANIQTNSISSSLTLPQIQTEITNGHPFIFRWGWSTGGGHFLVGFGISGSTINYMNPWVGEGYAINNYNWVVSGTDADGTHTWTHTQTLGLGTGITNLSQQQETIIFPNPSEGKFILNSETDKGEISISNIAGQKVYLSTINNQSSTINLDLPNGIYFLQLKTEQGITTQKLIINK